MLPTFYFALFLISGIFYNSTNREKILNVLSKMWMLKLVFFFKTVKVSLTTEETILNHLVHPSTMLNGSAKNQPRANYGKKSGKTDNLRWARMMSSPVFFFLYFPWSFVCFFWSPSAGDVCVCIYTEHSWNLNLRIIVLKLLTG